MILLEVIVVVIVTPGSCQLQFLIARKEIGLSKWKLSLVYDSLTSLVLVKTLIGF